MIEEAVVSDGSIPTEKKNVFSDLTKDPLSWAIIIGITVFFTVFMVIPLSFTLYSAFVHNGQIKLSTFSTLFSNKEQWNPTHEGSEYAIQVDAPPGQPMTIKLRGHDYGVILNSIFIAIGTTTISLFLGLTTAFIMARVDFPGKTIVSGLLLIPLVLPPFVGGIGYIALMGPEGLINKYFLTPNFNVVILLEGHVAIILVQSLHYFTLIYLNIYSSLMNNDPSLEESAENLGADRLTVARTVTLPLAMPGIASGSILVLILALEDLGTPIIFAVRNDRIATKTLTFQILDKFFLGENTSEINQISAIQGTILLVFAIIGFFAIRKYVALKQYSMVSKGRAGEFRTLKPNIFGKILIYLFFFVLLFVATIPHWGVIIISLAKPQTFPLEFSLINYEKLFNFDSLFGRAIKNTLVYSFAATFVIVILATLAGYVANRKKFFGQPVFETLITIPIAIPGIVLGIGYFRMFGNTKAIDLGAFPLTLNPITYPVIILVISYTIRKFPFTMRAVYAGLQQTDEVLEESAINLGASRSRVIWEIIIPLIALNIVGGALVSLVYNMSEVSTTLILIQDENTYGTITKVMSGTNGKIGELAAMGVFLMAIQVVSLFVTNVLLRNRADAISGL